MEDRQCEITLISSGANTRLLDRFGRTFKEKECEVGAQQHSLFGLLSGALPAWTPDIGHTTGNDAVIATHPSVVREH
jgi:hypothetical protein